MKKRITKLFKTTPVRITFRTQNTIKDITTPYSQIDKQEKWHIPNGLPRLPIKIYETKRPNILRQI
jgi:hypothetical protein